MLQNAKTFDVWAVGCGLGRDEAAIQCVQNLWHSDQPRLVLDADALHILADYPDKFRKHKHNDLVLTPHPGEAAHLLNITIKSKCKITANGLRVNWQTVITAGLC